jgi:hypothetical protein
MLHFFVILCIVANVRVAAHILILRELNPCVVCFGVYIAVGLALFSDLSHP